MGIGKRGQFQWWYAASIGRRIRTPHNKTVRTPFRKHMRGRQEHHHSRSEGI